MDEFGWDTASSQRESAGSSRFRPPLLSAWMRRLVPPRPPETRKELKERVLAKYGATSLTNDDLAALMALQSELAELFLQIRSFTNMSDGLRLTFAMRIGTQRTVVIVCATRRLRHRIKEVLDQVVAKRLLNRYGFTATVIVRESIRYLYAPDEPSHASLVQEAWDISKAIDKVMGEFATTALATRVSVSYWPESLENRPAAIDVTIGGIVLMDGKLHGLTTAHGLGNTPTSDTPGEREPLDKGKDIYTVPAPAMLVAASSNFPLRVATSKQRQAWGGGGVRRGDWALVELPEDEILPNILLSEDDDRVDLLSDWKDALWPTGHSSTSERQQPALLPSSKAPRTTSPVPSQKGGAIRLVDTIFSGSLVGEHLGDELPHDLPCVMATTRGPIKGLLHPVPATLNVEGKIFQVLRVLLDRPLCKSKYNHRLERALTR